MRLSAATTVRIGARATAAFAAGWYIYAGSAQGSGGLAARLARHRRAEKRLHWHIDWLLPAVELVEVWVRPGATGRECGWVTALETLSGHREPPRFGSGDCRCPGHLVHFADRPDLTTLCDEANAPAFRPW